MFHSGDWVGVKEIGKGGRERAEAQDNPESGEKDQAWRAMGPMFKQAVTPAKLPLFDK